MKTCTKCKQEFPETTEYFFKKKGGKNGLNAQCKKCHMEAVRANPNFMKQQRASWLRTRYKLTPEQFETMLEQQKGRCGICKEERNERLCVDHDHETGEVRGLLCRQCNKALGGFRDSQELLLNAQIWLETH